MGRFQPRGPDDTGVVGFLPELDAHTPLIACLETGETELGARRYQIVADRCLMPEELIVHHHADRVLPYVVGTGVTFPVAIKSGERIGTASLQRGSQYIFNHS